jgi:hypothetical protein
MVIHPQNRTRVDGPLVDSGRLAMLATTTKQRTKKAPEDSSIGNQSLLWMEEVPLVRRWPFQQQSIEAAAGKRATAEAKVE